MYLCVLMVIHIKALAISKLFEALAISKLFVQGKFPWALLRELQLKKDELQADIKDTD